MKRFHVHLNVHDLASSIRFYSALFQQPPSRTEADYAKWLLDDPPVNFAISTRGAAPGLDHLGIQVDQGEDLAALKAQARQADLSLRDEGETTCCYARSDKYWITDPQGVAWEHFHTLDGIPVFSETPPRPSACCTPNAPASTVAAATASGCCPSLPQSDTPCC